MLSKVFLVDKIAFIDINILFYCMIYFSKLEQEDILVIKLLHVIFFFCAYSKNRLLWFLISVNNFFQI